MLSVLLFYGGKETERNKMNSVKKTHKVLSASIDYVIANKNQYVKNPESDFTRNRKCNLRYIIETALSFGGGSLNTELYDFAKARNNKNTFTSSAFVQQRSKVSGELFKDLFYHFNDGCKGFRTYRGYRIVAVDGSEVPCARNPDSKFFMTDKEQPGGYNKILLIALYDVLTRTYLDAEHQPRKKWAEREALINMLERNKCQEKMIILCDRGYESFNVLAHLIEAKNTEFLCRVKQGSTAIREIAHLPMEELDIDIPIEITTAQTNEDKINNRHFIQTGSKKGKTNSAKTVISRWDFKSPYTLNLRVVRVLLDSGEYETLVTSLSRHEFSAEQLKELYHMRWGIETSFRELKYVMGLIHLHSKKDDLILQEIYAALTMYNYCSRMSASAPVRKRQQCKYAYKINFVMAVHICKRFYRSIINDFKELIDDISKYSEPIRLGRRDKRKLRPKFFAGFLYRAVA